VTLLLAALLVLAPSFRFRPFDEGLPRTGQWRHGFAVADMNGDGRPDLAFSSPRKQPGPPVIFLNQGHGRWTRWEGTRFPALPFDYGAVAAADFDRNGTNDLAIASHYRGVTVVLGDGNGTFVPSQDGMNYPTTAQGSNPFSSRAIVATDWNGDGRIDVAALSDGPRPAVGGAQLGVTVFENLGFAWKPLRATNTDIVHGDAIAAGDVDGDHLPDLVTASLVVNHVRVLRLGADPALAARELAATLPVSTVRAASLCDFDGNGRDEIVLAYSSPTGAAIDVVSYPTEARLLWSEEGSAVVAAVAAGDINGDGSADIVAAMQDGRLLTFRGDGHGFATNDTVLAPPEWRAGCAAYAVDLADLDGDGRDEVIATFAGEARCATAGGVEVWRAERARKRRAVR
jgi:hypothetical protein